MAKIMKPEVFQARFGACPVAEPYRPVFAVLGVRKADIRIYNHRDNAEAEFD